MDRMEGFTFAPRNEPCKSGKREYSRPIEGEHSASKIFQKNFETPKFISLTCYLIHCRIVGACEEEMSYEVKGNIQQKLMFQTHFFKNKVQTKCSKIFQDSFDNIFGHFLYVILKHCEN